MSGSSEHQSNRKDAGWLRTARSWLGIGSVGDWTFKQVCMLCSLLVVVLIALIVILLYRDSRLAFQQVGWQMVTSDVWAPEFDPVNHDDEDELNPKETPPELIGRFGGFAFVLGSIITTALSMAIAVPLGVGTAAFLSEIASPRLKRSGSFFVELLAAIPSVIYGFWGIAFLAPALQHLLTVVGIPNTAGKGFAASSLILAIMIVPYVTAVSFDVCQAVPRSQREGSLALGASRWQTIWKVVLPYARPGIVGGCFLAMGRAVGETMAVTMMIGNSDLIRWISLLGIPIPTLEHGLATTIPSKLASDLAGANSDKQRSVLIALALVLFGITILLNIIARILIARVGRVDRGFTLPFIGFIALPALSAKPSAASAGPRQRLQGSRWAPLKNNIMTGVLACCLALTCVPLFLILSFITYKGMSALNLSFFWQLPHVVETPHDSAGGLSNALVGSCIIVGTATLFAVPLGLLAAIYLAEFRTSRLAPTVRFFGELLNGVPSIVIGTFVYALMSAFVDLGWLGPSYRFSGLAGSFALFTMMLPIVIRASEEALKLVPQSLRLASHALGAHHWQTVWRVCVPAAMPAIITGVFLAIARIAGETAPLLLTAFGDDHWVIDPTQKMAALPMYIYRDATDAVAQYQQRAWAGAMVLVSFVMLLNIGIRVVTGKRVVLASQAD